MKRSLSFFLSILMLAALAVPAHAGTTGGLSGTITDSDTHAPVAGARVTVTSPSQTVSADADAAGHFVFVSLAPDTYTVTLAKPGYDSVSFGGAIVFADAQQTLTFLMHKTLKTIAHVTSQSASNLVRSGTTADIYSVNAAQQERVSALGGGSNMNSAFSAIASVPGAYVPSNQSGYLTGVHVRGGDAYEVGYEFDGIPVNRAFDNYPSSALSSLGQLELQVYTGATPAGAEAQGLAGFVNQVIKSGTYPGYATAGVTVGSPTFYHDFQAEVGGATPDRTFSYYVGFDGFNQQHRFVDQFNGAAYAPEFGQQLAQCPTGSSAYGVPINPKTYPSCFTNGKPNVGPNGTPGWLLGPFGFGTANPIGIADRTFVANFHFAIPHKNDGLRDDVQLLYDNDEIFTTFSSSVADEGLPNWLVSTGGAIPPYYYNTYSYHGPIGTLLPNNYQSMIGRYLYPSSEPQGPGGTIPDGYYQRDGGFNGQGIVKLQYQKNFSPSSYLRLYGYTYYSDWIENGPMETQQFYAYYDSGDYEINNHTHGVSLSYANQLDSHNLLNVEGSYTTANGARIYNEQMFAYGRYYGNAFAELVNAKDPMSGTCYRIQANGTATFATTCYDGGGSGVSYGSGRLPSFVGLNGGGSTGNVGGLQCGNGPCAYFAAENGAYGLNNTVKPAFSGYSITDQWRPNDKLNVNAGVRVDNYSFVGPNTDTGAARDFWFKAFNQDTCYNTTTLTLVDRSALLPKGGWTTNSQVPCSSFGKQYVNANLQNTPAAYDYNIVQPRIGATYTINPDTVLRASYGKYNEQPSAAYVQYNALEQNLPDTLTEFYALGFRTPGHNVAPSISFNSDFSLEHHIHGTDMSFKLSPFLRQTQGEVSNFYINYTTGLVSGLNAGYQTSRGFEFQFDKGDFSRNGFSGQLSFAYTYATFKYSPLPNGTTLMTPINTGIAQYNAYTKGCAPGGKSYGKTEFGSPVCGSTSNGLAPAPCYTTGGAPDPSCAKGSFANPYWNSPAFSLYDPNASYIPYSIFPGPVGSGVNAYNYPYVTTLILNYKHDKLAITPSFQFTAGNRYGAPLTMPGIDPAAGCGVLPGSTGGDPRYPYGAKGGSPYDSHSCGSDALSIPDPYTGQFDPLGGFREPAQLLAHLRISYDVSPRINLTLTLANLLQTCFGGQTTGFTYLQGNNVCLYTNLNGGPSSPPAGNAYNPRDNVQTFLRYPYEPYFGVYNDQSSSITQPFNAFFNVKVKI